jgi:hypothetical protein
MVRWKTWQPFQRGRASPPCLITSPEGIEPEGAFYDTARARLQACSDFDTNCQFLVDHIERVTYNRYQVAIVGSVPVRTVSEENGLPLRIEGKIDMAAIRSNSCRRAALAAMRSTPPVADTPTDQDQLASLPRIRYADTAA